MAARDAASAISGITFVDDDMMQASLIMVFDDAKTGIEKIRGAMKKAGFPIEGEPEYLKPR
jgi:copper chaperone CopZ